jgi:hypothetical protein
MGWFKDLIGNVARAETVDFVLTPPLTVNGQAPGLAALEADTTYLQVDIKALRLPFKREGVTRYHGLVHVFADLPGRNGQTVQFANATTPSKLAGLDPKHVSNVLTINKRVVGPTPWSGGDLMLQIGLFSVVEQDLAGPFLSTITALSDKVGVAFAATAKPFIDIIGAGVQALTAKEGSVKLEVGLDLSVSPPVTGYYALVATAKDKLNGAQFDLDPNDFRLKVNGQPYVDKPYLVFGVSAVTQQERWGEIEDLRTAYQAVRDAIVANDQDKATEAFVVFRRLARISLELIDSDAERLIEKVEALLTKAFGQANRSKGLDQAIPEFEAIALY